MKKFCSFFLKNLFFAVCLLVAISSCKKDSSVGIGTLDENEILNGITVDTFDLITYTVEEDSLITDNGPNGILGSYNDPKFGTFNASIYTQLRIGTVNPNFGNTSSIIMDSVVLALEYAGYYGDQSTQTFEVYELDEDLHIDSTYYSFTTKSIKSTNLIPFGKGVITPKPTKPTIVGGDTVDSQLRIHLDTNFAKALIAEAASGSTTFENNENFVNFFKGIHIKTNNGFQAPGVGAALYVKLNDPSSKITMYFRQDGIFKTFDLFLNASCADFTHVDINSTGTSVENVVQNNTLGKNEFYAQALKHRAIVKIPGLNNLPQKTIIHKAELSLPIQYQTGYRYKPGIGVSVATKVKSTDNFYTSLSTFGEYSDVKKLFFVDIRSYAQSIVAGDLENTGLVISPRFFINSAERIVFNGLNTTNKVKPKLILTYTTY
ncbi:MAG: DUF4270 family protein [Bacteroidota bacterium]